MPAMDRRASDWRERNPLSSREAREESEGKTESQVWIRVDEESSESVSGRPGVILIGGGSKAAAVERVEVARRASAPAGPSERCTIARGDA
jgi:hypothetical protein